MKGPIRIIGWGNDGRSDDGAALRLLAGLESLQSDSGNLQLDGYHQLGPEIACDLTTASLVIFVDAHVDDERPALSWERVTPEPATTMDSHHCSPAELVSFCHAMKWTTPPCFLLAIRAHSFDYGDELSAETQALVAQGIQFLQKVLAQPSFEHLEELSCDPSRLEGSPGLV